LFNRVLALCEVYFRHDQRNFVLEDIDIFKRVNKDFKTLDSLIFLQSFLSYHHHELVLVRCF
jgi:hypothetical protein